jgi:hypothetical protein
MSYNGHKNWNAWNVALWISNDEGLYSLACQCVKEYPNKDKAAEALMNMLPAKTPDGAPYSFTNVRAALVDWH